MKKYKYTLSHTTEGALELTHSPDGWDSKSISFTRSETYRTVLRNFSLSLRFPFEGRDYIETIFTTYGINAVVTVLIEELDPSDFTYNTYYTGVLDLTTYRKTRDFVEVAIIDSQVMAKFQGRDEIVLPLNQAKTIDDEAIAGTVESDLIVRGVDIISLSHWEGDTYIYNAGFNAPIGYTYKYFGITDEEWDGNENDDLATLPGKVIAGESSATLFENTGAESLNMGYRFDQDIGFSLDVDGDFDYRVFVDNYLIINGVTVRTESYDSGVIFGLQHITGSIEIRDRDSDFTLNAAAEVRLYTKLSVYNMTAENVDVNDVVFNINNQDIRIWINVPTAADSTIKAVLPHEGLERLLKITTGASMTLNSTILGRTDISYDIDGDASLVAVAGGFGLRGFGFSEKPLKTSIRDFFQSFLSLYNIGLWYDSANSRFEVKTLDNYYKNNLMITLGEVKELSIEVFDQGYFNEIAAGHSAKVSYENDSTIYSFGVRMTLTTNSILRGLLDLSTPFRIDDYGIEYARKKDKQSTGGEDTRYDEDNFLIYSERNGSDIQSVRWDFPTDTVTGLTEYESRMNYDITPKRNLLRNGNLLGTVGYIDEGQIKVTGTQFNVALTTQKGDWYLPSKDELNAMYTNLFLEGVGGFDTSTPYWSSSEDVADNAWGQGFSSGTQGQAYKVNTRNIRPSRTFTASAGAYSLRDVGPEGGWIYYINGTTYYEAAPADLPAAAWSNVTGTAVTGTGTAIGTGADNTTLIIEQTDHTSSAARDCVDSSDDIAEMDDIDYADLPEPLFYPEIYTFTAPVTQAQIATLMTDPHGYVEFSYLGTTYKGYILEVSTEPYMREGNWTLIKINENR